MGNKINNKLKRFFAVTAGLFVCISVVCLTGCTASEHISLEEAIFLAEEDLSKEQSEDLQNSFLKAQETKPVEDVYVYVCGAVLNPGVYTIAAGSRIVTALEAAGGFLENAAAEAVNLAEPVQDGMQILIPSMEEYEASVTESKRSAQGMIDLNTATITELCTLSGIGETKAEAILSYRSEIGGFTDIAQLKEVSGIGDRLFEQIKDGIYID